MKRKIYAEANICEYWIVNLNVPRLIVWRSPLLGDYQTKETLTRGIIRPLTFPDITISVEHILP